MKRGAPTPKSLTRHSYWRGLNQNAEERKIARPGCPEKWRPLWLSRGALHPVEVVHLRTAFKKQLRSPKGLVHNGGVQRRPAVLVRKTNVDTLIEKPP